MGARGNVQSKRGDVDCLGKMSMWLSVEEDVCLEQGCNLFDGTWDVFG